MARSSDKFDRYEDGGVVFPNGSYFDPETRSMRRVMRPPPATNYAPLMAKFALANLLRSFLAQPRYPNDLLKLQRKMGVK